jgi:hypothetical protein
MPPPTGQKIVHLVTVQASVTRPLAARFLVVTDLGALYDLEVDYSTYTATFTLVYAPAGAAGA